MNKEEWMSFAFPCAAIALFVVSLGHYAGVSTYGLVVVFFSVSIVFAVGYFVPLWGATAENEANRLRFERRDSIRSNGKWAPAEVLKIRRWRDNASSGEFPWFKERIWLLVNPADERPFETVITGSVPRKRPPQAQPGEFVAVRYDPDSYETVICDAPYH